MDYLRRLNSAQREAVTTLSGPLLVLAGAGTGKTRVITVRMAELIRTGTPANRILSVTFTNKAAREMRERVLALLGRRPTARPVVSTFHAFCVRVLRQEITTLGYPAGFVIYNRGDQEAAARTALRDIRVADKAMRPGDLVGRISRWKTAGIAPCDASDHAENDFDYLAARAYRKYQQKLRSSGAVDFDDLLLLTGELMREHPQVLERQQARFDRVQIDEYQDTNRLQFQLVQALVEQHQNLCAVGDDDQSIYGWRGADVEHILGFAEHFPGSKIVRLEQNYRCTAQILDIANRLVRCNRSRHNKILLADRRGTEVRFQEFSDATTESEGVVREICCLHQEHNIPLRDFAILFRTNEQPRPFEAELRRVRLPYVLIGSQSFFDRREIRDLLAYLKVAANPDDEVSILRIINTPARGIGANTVQRLTRDAIRQKRSLWGQIAEAVCSDPESARTTAALKSFRSLIERYRRDLNRTPRQMASILRRLVDEIDYESEIRKQYRDEQQQAMRLETVRQLIDQVGEYAARARQPNIIDFLEESALLDREEEVDREEQAARDAVKLMTLHSAKGLEFRRVYLVGLEEGLLPHRRSLEGPDSTIDEERRLCYVGITRACDHLTITRAAARRKWGRDRPAIPSRFLFEMRRDADTKAETEELSGQ